MNRGLIKPKVVKDGPVKEVILKGDDVDVTRLPVHVHSSSDRNCPYIGSGMSFVKDPETGIQNIALQRNQVRAPQRLGVCVAPGRHTDIIVRKWWKMGKPCPFIIVSGHHPAYYIASTWTTRFGIDEIEIAGALLQKPVQVVRSETADIMVPADAGIIIEGEIPINGFEDEGPFGEHAGWSMGVTQQPYVNLKAITMRKDAIYYALQGAKPISESQPLDAFPMEFVIYNLLQGVGGACDIRDVVTPTYAGGCHVVIVQMVPQIEGEVRSVLMAALSSPYLHPKIAIAVDEDIDPNNAQSIWWAISTRVNPKTDVFVIPDTLGHANDSSLEALPVYEGEGALKYHQTVRIGSKLLIDATKGPLRWPAQMRGVFSPTFPQGYHDVKLEDYKDKG